MFYKIWSDVWIAIVAAGATALLRLGTDSAVCSGGGGLETRAAARPVTAPLLQCECSSAQAVFAGPQWELMGSARPAGLFTLSPAV